MLLLLPVIAVVVAGCGGAGGNSNSQSSPSETVTTPQKKVILSKVAYDRRMKQLGKQLAASVDTLFPLVEGKPGSQASKDSVAKLKRTRAVVTSVMASVADIAPPAPIRAEHQRLLRGISALSVELDKLIEVEENGSKDPFGSYTRFNSLRTIAKARIAIEGKGYAIG
jgi:hypothetical protein